MEFRFKEHYVDEVEYELPPKDKRPRIIDTRKAGFNGEDITGEDTGAEADNEKSEYETEGDQESLLTADPGEEPDEEGPPAETIPSPSVLPPTTANTTTLQNPTSTPKRKRVLIARPFSAMRGHTAFLTFATSGNALQSHPESSEELSNAKDDAE
jgi:hypothetical protein